jgi:hypothetical protein
MDAHSLRYSEYHSRIVSDASSINYNELLAILNDRKSAEAELSSRRRIADVYRNTIFLLSFAFAGLVFWTTRKVEGRDAA